MVDMHYQLYIIIEIAVFTESLFSAN